MTVKLWRYPRAFPARDRCGAGTDFGCQDDILHPEEKAHAIWGFRQSEAVLFHAESCCPCAGCLAQVETRRRSR